MKYACAREEEKERDRRQMDDLLAKLEEDVSALTRCRNFYRSTKPGKKQPERELV